MKIIVLSIIATVGFSGAAMASQGGSIDGKLRQMSSGIEVAQSCGSGMNVCAPGSYGPGGCYKPGYATCTAGLVCTGGMQACKPSNGGAAYCYKPGYGKCK